MGGGGQHQNQNQMTQNYNVPNYSPLKFNYSFSLVSRIITEITAKAAETTKAL